jgi:hypothetical protein
MQSCARNVLNALHEFDQAVLITSSNGSEANAAVAHHSRGHAMRGRRHEGLIPKRLTVVVRVDINKSRRHERSIGVDLPVAALWYVPDGDYSPINDRDIGESRWRSCAIDDRTGPNNQVVQGHYASDPLGIDPVFSSSERCCISAVGNG